MKMLMAVILLWGLVGTVHDQLVSNTDSLCIYQQLPKEDAMFCKGNLSVVYSEIGDVSCKYIPVCNKFRQKIGIWDQPSIRYSQADENKKYVLMMVDPDAPSRSNPKRRYWRHWLTVNMNGNDLKTGDLQGNELTSYQPPSPPENSGYHRYQFILFEQPDTGKPITLSSKERANRGSWSINAFIKHFHLGSPVAASQFLTQNYNDF